MFLCCIPCYSKSSLKKEYNEFHSKRLSLIGKMVYLGSAVVHADKKNFPALIEIIERLSAKAKMNMPTIFVYEDHLFAKIFSYIAPVDLRFEDLYVGLIPELSAIIIGKSLIKKLSIAELESLIAHELVHIARYHGLKKSAALLTYPIVTGGALAWGIKNYICGGSWLSWLAPFVVLNPVSQAGILLSITYFNRTLEKDADLGALKICENKALKSALVKKEDFYRDKHEIWGFFGYLYNRAFWWASNKPSLSQRKRYIKYADVPDID